MSGNNACNGGWVMILMPEKGIPTISLFWTGYGKRQKHLTIPWLYYHSRIIGELMTVTGLYGSDDGL